MPQVVFQVASFTERDVSGEASGRCDGALLYLGGGLWLGRFLLMLSKMLCTDTVLQIYLTLTFT